LTGETVGGSPEYLKNARELDARMYGGIGAFFGFAVTVALCKTLFARMYLSDVQIYGAAIFIAAIASAFGRYVARRKL
jgi:hypothetical protein